MKLTDIYKPALLNQPVVGLAEVIGEAAMYEQLAEECAELSKAAMKLARYMYGENKVHKPYDEVLYNFHEEVIDVLITLHEIMATETFINNGVISEIENCLSEYTDEMFKERPDAYMLKWLCVVSSTEGTVCVYRSHYIRKEVTFDLNDVFDMDGARIGDILGIITVLSNRSFFNKEQADDILAYKLERMRSRLSTYRKENNNA